MDIANVNINRLYGIVSAAGNDQILNVADDQKTLTLADGGAELTPEQIERNRQFHEKLLTSLQEITRDKTVMDEVRSKLGLSQDGGEVVPKPIAARQIKLAIDLVMEKVSSRIGEVLTQRQFPKAVNRLILEAVKANPKHAVVTAFLAKDGGTLDNLARLCRLTCQSLKGGANSAALAYLDGFAYKVADFEDVKQVSDSDNQQYKVGVSHYEEELKAQANKPKEQSSVKEEQQSSVKEEQQSVKQEQPSGVNVLQPSEKKWQKLEVIQEEDEGLNVNEANPNAKPEEPNAEVGKLREAMSSLYSGNMSDMGIELLTFIERDPDCANSMSIYLTLCPDVKNAEHRLVDDGERYLIFANAINSMWKDVRNLPDAVAQLKQGLQKIVDNAGFKYEQVVRFRTAVEDVKADLDLAKTAASQMRNGMPKTAKLAYLDEIVRLGQIDADGGVFQEMRMALTDAQTLKTNERDALKNKLREILRKGNARFAVESLRDKRLKNRLDIIETNIMPKTINRQSKLYQGADTSLCYLRSVENGLIANGTFQKLPTPDRNGMYTFRVDVGGTKVGLSELTVSKDEIEDLKKWYDANWRRYNTVKGKDKGFFNFSGSRQVSYDKKNTTYDGFATYKSQLKSFSDLDWAINLAQTKLAMWKDAQKGLKTGQVAAPAKLKTDTSSKGWTFVRDGYPLKSYEPYLNNQLITQMGRDTDVAEFFGLVQDQTFAINHNLGTENPNELSQPVKEANVEDLFARWNEAREWKANNENGVLTLNEAGGHFVTIRDFYYENDDNFGFIIRDSNDKDGEKVVNVRGFAFTELADGECQTLNVHGFKPRAA